jgi:hypothetical protein
VEGWSFNFFPAPATATPIKRVGVNLGAPGDHVAENGMLWLEFPSVGGPSPDVPVFVEAESPQLFRYHMSHLKKDKAATAASSLSWVAASGIEGLTAITIWPFLLPAGDGADDEVKAFERHAGTNQLPPAPAIALGSRGIPWRYSVRLHFAEPRDLEPGERVFDVFVQGKKVLEGFDIVKAAGGTWKAVVVELSGIEVTTDLRIEMKPSRPGLSRGPLLCGLELVAEE